LGITQQEDDVELWPELLPAWQIFRRMTTQWRVGMGGAIGLDYLVMFDLMRRADVSDADWLDMLDDLRWMENGALQEMQET
jgi:hypothetical protein